MIKNICDSSLNSDGFRYLKKQRNLMKQNFWIIFVSFMFALIYFIYKVKSDFETTFPWGYFYICLFIFILFSLKVSLTFIKELTEYQRIVTDIKVFEKTVSFTANRAFFCKPSACYLLQSNKKSLIACYYA